MNVWKIVSTVSMIGGAILAIVGGIANDKIQKIEIAEAVKKAKSN